MTEECDSIIEGVFTSLPSLSLFILLKYTEYNAYYTPIFGEMIHENLRNISKSYE